MSTDPKPDSAPSALNEALDALPDAVSVFDYEFRLRYVNRVAAEHLRSSGIDPETVVGKVAWDTLPNIRGSAWERALRDAASSRAPVIFERHSPTLGGWTETRIVPTDSVITATTRDMAARHEAEQRAAHSQALLHAILNNTTDAIYVKDRDGRYLAMNSAGAAVFGRTPDEVIGRTNFDFLPRETAEQFREIELDVLRRGSTTHHEQTFQVDGTPYHFLVASGVWRDAQGDVAGIVGVSTNITERRRREDETRLLAEAGRVLAESLDYRATLNAVAKLVTPAIADWCSVVVVNPKGELKTLAVAHADPEKVKWAREFGERYPEPADAPSGVPNVVRTGKSELYPEITDEMLVAVARDEEHLKLIRALQMRSVLIVPMSVHGRTLGAIVLIGAESGRRYSERDLPIIEELARRASLAIENAELFQAAATANRAKSEFLASMSHELRTPLNAIIGYAELLGEGITGPVNANQQEQLLRIRSSASHLLGLIDEVLSFSRLEAGHERITPQDVAVAVILEEAAALVRPMAAAKRLPLVVEAPEPGARVQTDVLKLRQILVNLLTNAVKFTDEGSVTLAVEADDAHICFIVRDTGIGIAPSHLRSVFEPFWQVEQHATRRVGGTGLGLSVTRRLARLLDGDVSVESVPGKGSTFVVRLPRALLPVS